jgi:hypothetical protein
MYFPVKNSPGVIRNSFYLEDPLDAYAYPSLCECTDCDECESVFDKEFPIDGT